MLRHRILVAITAVAALVVVAGASGEPVNGYAATGSPSHVKPSTEASYAITLTNDALSPKEADQAKIGIPADFVVAAASVQGSASAAGACVASTWVPDGTLIADGNINLKRPPGTENRLCPGATLTVTFSATSSAVDGTYSWETQLLRGEVAFILNGAQPTVRVDGTSPLVTLTSHPANPSNVPSPSFGFSATEPAGFQCKLDGASYAACTSPTTYVNLVDGTHTFTVRAADAAGNTGEASYTWLIETELPIVTVTDKPANPTKSSSATFAFTATESGTFECRLDGGASAPCTSPTSYTDLADGPHTFAVKATDDADNTGPETTYAWTVDTVPPVPSLAQTPSNPSGNASSTFHFSASEAASFRCKLDGAPFAACTSPKSYAPEDGSHTFAVEARDAAGNTGEATYTWTIDTVRPTVTITQKPLAASNDASPQFAFVASEAATFQCTLDDRGFEPCSSPASYAGLGEGSHAFVVRATDAAGNVGAASRSWTIDLTAPETTLDSKPAARTTATSAVFRFYASEAATFECRLDGGGFAPCSSPKAYAGLANGLHRFAVRAVDAAGNVDPTAAVAEWAVARITRAAARSALFAPAGGARVTRPPLLRWRAVRRATYYNVQLYRAGRKVLTAWPARTSLQLRARWRFGGKVQRLRPGPYRWYVWPGYGQASARRYGSLLGTSTFVVARGAGRR